MWFLLPSPIGDTAQRITNLDVKTICCARRIPVVGETQFSSKQAVGMTTGFFGLRLHWRSAGVGPLHNGISEYPALLALLHVGWMCFGSFVGLSKIRAIFFFLLDVNPSSFPCLVNCHILT